MVAIDDETQRTTALAYWRYGHDYLRCARTLSCQHRLRSLESQVVFHLAAQGIEFALKAYLRAKGASPQLLITEVGHSLTAALERSRAVGLGPLPASTIACIEVLAPHHQERQFTHLDRGGDDFADALPFVAAGVAILDRIVPDVVADYVDHHAAPASPPASEFIQRLRADLIGTAEGIAA
jgi:hypothetical protein